MTTDELAQYRAVLPTATSYDFWIIAKGNEMLAQAGMPPLTPEQARKFLENRKARKEGALKSLLALVGAGTGGYLIGKLSR